MGAATATHGEMAMPRAVHRDPHGELAQRLAHAAELEACWEHAKALFDDLAEQRAAARRRYIAALN